MTGDRRPPEEAAPVFSVVVPTFERPEALARCLDSLAPHAQTLDAARYEVIVTDAGTASLAAPRLAARYPWVRFTRAPGAWPGINRNHGAACARGEWVTFLDDDCTVERDFLARLERHAAPDVDVIEGKLVCPDARDQPLAVCPRNDVGGLFWTANLTVRRRRFLALGAFDEELGRLEDMEFAHRLRVHGVRTVFAADAPAYHPRDVQTLRQYWRRSLLARWSLLYRMKIGASAPPEAPLVVALARVAIGEGVGLLRTTYHLVSRHDPLRWRTNAFRQAWNWATLPVLLPYLLWWEMQFRRRTRA